MAENLLTFDDRSRLDRAGANAARCGGRAQPATQTPADHGARRFGDLPVGLQAKLLSAVENRRIRRVGGETEIDVDVRIVAATNRNLAAEVAVGRFRSDLFHRLSVFQIHIPRLAERLQDLEELVWALIAEFNERVQCPISRVPGPVWEALRAHSWPGNVRELRNVVERCVLLSPGDTLDPHWLALAPLPAAAEPTADALCFALDGSVSLNRFERRVFQEALKRRRGNVTQAARLLGISRQTMRYRLEKYRLKPDLTQDDTADRTAYPVTDGRPRPTS